MYVVALTGGFGSGKSTVSSMLAGRGAVIVDADVLAREVVEPGSEGFREVVDAFGPRVVGPDGSLDRAALAGVVFGDETKRKQLEAIIHPRVGARIAEKLDELRAGNDIVVLDIPLLVESRSGSRSLAQAIVVVAASEEAQLRHLRDKGVSQEDARARIAAQAPLEEKLQLADYVIWNDGSLEELEKRVGEVWEELRAKAVA